MSVSPSALLAEWDRVRNSLAVISVSHEELDRFFSGAFDQLDALSAELLLRQRAFLAEREEAERELQRRAVLLDQQAAALALQRETAPKDNSSQAAQEAIQTQAVRLAELADTLLHSQKELVKTNGDIQRQRVEWEAARAQEPTPASPVQAELQEKLERLEQERAALDRQRILLEAELESVRGRAAEMAESLAQQQRQMVQERDQWTGELKYLRRLVERLAQQPAKREPAVAAGPAGAEHHGDNGRAQTASTLEAAGDPVLDSVMAQFTLLQKDLAQRRRTASHPEPS